MSCVAFKFLLSGILITAWFSLCQITHQSFGWIIDKCNHASVNILLCFKLTHLSLLNSSTSSEETQDTEETCSTTGDADPDNSQDQCNQESGDKDSDKDQSNSVKVKEEKKDKECEGAVCKVCSGDHTKNKDGQSEVLIHCAQCTSSGK